MKNEQERLRIGQRISDLRAEVGISQQRLADKAGLQRAHITRIEAGQYGVTLDVLASIAEALGKEIDFVEKGERRGDGG